MNYKTHIKNVRIFDHEKNSDWKKMAKLLSHSIFTTIKVIVFTLSIASTTVSVDTMEFGQPNKNHQFDMFALSFATATNSVDTILFCVHINNYSTC